MIEYQQRFPEFPGEPWCPLSSWQMLSLGDIKNFRFKFHGNLVEDRKHLNAYIEQEIIHARLLGKTVDKRFLNHEYKK